MLLHLILSIFCYSALAAALNSSTYYFAQEDTNITFTLTAAADTGDLFFRLSAPGSYDWVSIGIGSSMKDALTFIAYPSKNGTCMLLLYYGKEMLILDIQHWYGHRDFQVETRSQLIQKISIALLYTTSRV
jgi:hypothetical protein